MGHCHRQQVSEFPLWDFSLCFALNPKSWLALSLASQASFILYFVLASVTVASAPEVPGLTPQTGLHPTFTFLAFVLSITFYHPGLHHQELDDYNRLLLHTLPPASPTQVCAATAPAFYCADSQSHPRLCSCLSLILRLSPLPWASCPSSLALPKLPVLRDSALEPSKSAPATGILVWVWVVRVSTVS